MAEIKEDIVLNVLTSVQKSNAYEIVEITHGYVKVKLNLERVNLIDSSNIVFEADIFKAEDFQLNWTNDWNITSSGRIEFSIASIDIYLNGIWYHIWPWT